MRILFTVLIILTIASQAWAQTTFKIDNIDYKVTNAEKHEVSIFLSNVHKTPIRREPKGNFFIPSTVEYEGVTYTVTSIDDFALYDCLRLTSVVIPNSVTTIGNYVFDNCRNLKSVTIPNSVTSIGRVLFGSCYQLTEINVAVDNSAYLSEDGILFNKDKTELICYPAGKTDSTYTVPNTVTTIGDFAFENCEELLSVTLPDSVTTIGYYAFSYCGNLSSVTIPESVTSIGEGAFKYCYDLPSIIIPESVTTIGQGAFHQVKNIIYSGSAEGCPWGAWYVNAEADENGFIYADADKTQIAAYVGENTNVVIPQSVKHIGEKAFYYCRRLTSITIPNSVVSIGDNAFYNCSGLTSVTIPNSVTTIGRNAFYNCSGLTSVSIPNSVRSIGESAFYGCKKHINANFESIESLCRIDFENSESNPLCNSGHLYINNVEITELVIPRSVKNITDCMFYNCSGLTSVTIPNTVTSIG